MSTPRPTEADVEALVEVIVGHQRIPTYRANGQRCSGCDHLRDETDGANSPRHARHVAEQILASDWLAARDAEHERDRSAHSIRADLANLRAERWMARHDVQRARAEAAEAERDEARRELADLRAKVAGLHGGTHWCFDADEGDVVFEPDTKWWPCPTYALLPTEDDQ